MKNTYKKFALEKEDLTKTCFATATKSEDKVSLFLQRVKILLLEDIPGDAGLIKNQLKKANLNFQILVVDTKEQYISALEHYAPDIILSDHSLPSFNSKQVLSILQGTRLKIPFILITNSMSDEFAVEMIRKGADDYILKDRLNTLPAAILNAIERYRIEKEKIASEQQLVKSEKKFRALVEHSFDGVAIFSAVGTPTHVSQSIEHLLGYSFQEALQMSVHELVHPEDSRKFKGLVSKSLKEPGHTIKIDSLRLKNKENDWIWVELSLTNMLDDDTVGGIVSNFRNVSERKRAEKKLVKANRLYAFLSHINRLIVHAEDESKLLNELCRIAIDVCNFPLASITLAKQDAAKLNPKGNGQFVNECQCFDTGPLYEGELLKKLLVSEGCFVINSFDKEHKKTKIAAYAAGKGFKSAVILPLKKEDETCCFFTLYAYEANYFNEDEIGLLNVVRGDICFALKGIEKERQKQLSEEKLRHSELLLRQTQAIARLGSWEMDFTSDVLTLSEEAQHILGHNEHFESASEFFLSLYGKNSTAYLSQLLNEEEGTHGNTGKFREIIRKDGTKRYVHSKTQVKKTNGVPVGLYGIVHDVTEMKEVEAALSESEKFNKGVLSSLSSHVAVIDKTGTILRVNKAWDKFSKDNYGSPESTGEGSNYFKVCQNAADNGDAIAKQTLLGIQSLFSKENQVFEIEYPCQSPEEQRWFSLSAKVFGEDVTKVVIAHHDITQRRETEANNRFKANLLNTIGQAVVATDLDGKVNYWNQAAEKIYGWKEEEAVGKYILDLTPPQQTKEQALAVMQELQKGNNWTGEFYVQRKDGITFPAFVTDAPIYDEDGQLVGIIGISSDISEKKALQNQLLEQQRETEQTLIQARTTAEAANESKSKFLASMSHELRTPLNAVIGFSKILKSSKLSQEQQGEFLEYIESSGSMLLKLIGDILEISKIEEGKLTIQHEPFLFTETINAALSPYHFKANEKGLEFSLSIDPNVPEQVVGDSSRTNQILINLVGNALKFTKDGKINVAISRLQNIEGSDEKVWLQFLVEDTGIGIDQEKEDKIFEVFTQADNSIGRDFGGSGLGLAIIKELVILMGGTVSVKPPGSKLSEKGGPGSVFEVIIPYSLAAGPQLSKGDDNSNKENFSFTDLHILVVEDNLINQKLALHTLSNFGCKVTIVENGQDAIKMLLLNAYSLVFMDLQMPVMDGFEATKIIRDQLKSDIPIIGLTANAFKEDKEACLNAGMDDFVSKPFRPEQLKQAIINLVKVA